MRMFELLGGNWVQVMPDIDGSSANQFFGFSVAISGNGSFVASGSGPVTNIFGQVGHTKVYEVVTLPSACGSTYSDTTTITVDATGAGTLSSDATVCGSGNTGNLSLGGSQGSIIEDWEFRCRWGNLLGFFGQ